MKREEDLCSINLTNSASKPYVSLPFTSNAPDGLHSAVENTMSFVTCFDLLLVSLLTLFQTICRFYEIREGKLIWIGEGKLKTEGIPPE